MAVNKVEINGQPVIDLTQDTVTPESLKKGITAHSASGQRITGIAEGAGANVSYNTVEPNRYSVDLDNQKVQLDLTGLVTGSHYICNMWFRGEALDSDNAASSGDIIDYNITVFDTGNEQYDYVFYACEEFGTSAPIQYNRTLVLNLDALLEYTQNLTNYHGMAYTITEMIQSMIVSWD